MEYTLSKLEAQLSNATHPRDRVDALNQLAWELRRSNLEVSVSYHEQALALATQENYRQGLAYAKINEGFYNYSSYGKIGEAIASFLEAVDLLEQFKDCKGLGTAYSFLGYLYWSGAAYDKAFELVKTALGHHEEVADQEGIGWDLHTLGSFYEELGEAAKAQDFFSQALEAFKSIEDAFGMATALNGLASLHLKGKEHKEALAMLEDSLALSEAKGLGDSKAGGLMLKGDVYWEGGDLSTACGYHLKALMQYQQNGDVLGGLTAKMRLGQFYYEAKDYEEALKYVDQVKREAPEIKAQNKLLEAYALCAKIYEALEDYQQAYLNTQKYSALAEATMGDQRKSQTERMQAVAEAEQAQQQAEIERLRNVELKEAYDQIEKQQESIVASIRYASRIQKSILPSTQFLENHFTDSFLFFRPRDIVSGDFYWFAESDGKWVVGAIDCTGHGVPGAFMVVLGNTLLNDIVLDQGVTDPAEILRQMDARVIKTLQSGEAQANDGMDVAMLVYDPSNREVQFAGAKNPLLLVRNGEMQRVKGSVFAIGGQSPGKKPKRFETRHFMAQPGDVWYLFSDGFQDQFGGEEKTKYLTKSFRDLLYRHHTLPMKDQAQKLAEELDGWMEAGEERQTDDIIVMGLRID